MPRSLKIILSIFGWVIVFIGVALFLFVDADAYKNRLEVAASGAVGMDVRVGGGMGIRFAPALSVTLEDLHIRNRASDVLSAKEAMIGIEFFPLLRKEVQVRNVVLKHPAVSIERNSDGTYNFESQKAAGGERPALDLAEVSLSDGTLRYADKKSGGEAVAADCRVEVRSLRLSGGDRSNLLKELSFKAELACGKIKTRDVTVSDLKFSVVGKDGVFDFKPVRMRLFDGQGSGSIRADFSRAVPRYQVRYSLSQFRIEEFFKILSPQKVAEGTMDFSANLSMQGKTVDELKKSMSGEASLRGESLMLNGYDLDLEFSRFESSQKFNLVDVGAFFFAGPAGLAVTKGYDFASIFKGAGGVSHIRTLVSDWKIESGAAQALDVAMATNANRVALRGGLDFAGDRFDNVTIALIDSKGCIKVRQKINGPFEKPVVEKPGVLKSLAGPAVRLLKKGREILSRKECGVFYAGLVAPPK